MCRICWEFFPGSNSSNSGWTALRAISCRSRSSCRPIVWPIHENKRLQSQGKPLLVEPGDIDAAMQTASAIGDDTLQRKATGRVVPDSFTHGSSAQRQRWFMNGYREGTVAGCNTFRSENL